MKIEIMGKGCAKCKRLFKTIERIVAKEGFNVEIVKNEDIQSIMDAGVMMTPALRVDGVVKAAGRVPSEEEIVAILKGEI